MNIVLKRGATGEEVKTLQKYLSITADGIFGPKTEEAVKAWQKEHNLVVDGIVGPKTWATFKVNSNDIIITKKPLSVHISKGYNRTIKYIALHYTAGGSSKPGSAQAVRNVFIKRSASADFAVDDNEIVQFNPDLNNYYCWSVGDKKNPYSSGGTLYGKATNKNTISIEMCSNLERGSSASAANHPGWTLTDATINNAIKLTKYLMKEYNIPKENVIRHYDISGKLCPGVPGWNNEILYDKSGKKTSEKNNSSKWLEFKNKL